MADENEKEETTEEETKKEATSSTGKNPLVAVLLLINAIGLCAIAYMQMQIYNKKMSEPSLTKIVDQALESKQAGDEEDKPEKDQDGILLTLNPFTANLAQGDGPRRYVSLSAVLKFSNDSKEAEFAARKPQIRDSIISILNTKRPEDLLKYEGKNYLKEEIKSAINAFLIDGKVIDIFYVGFQIN